MPKPDYMMHFKNYHKQLPVPFVIYADFEAITKKVQDCKPNSSTEAHEDCGYGYESVRLYDDEYTKPTQVYVFKNAVYKFMEKMLYEVNYCKKVILQRTFA